MARRRLRRVLLLKRDNPDGIDVDRRCRRQACRSCQPRHRDWQDVSVQLRKGRAPDPSLRLLFHGKLVSGRTSAEQIVRDLIRAVTQRLGCDGTRLARTIGARHGESKLCLRDSRSLFHRTALRSAFRHSLVLTLPTPLTKLASARLAQLQRGQLSH